MRGVRLNALLHDYPLPWAVESRKVPPCYRQHLVVAATGETVARFDDLAAAELFASAPRLHDIVDSLTSGGKP